MLYLHFCLKPAITSSSVLSFMSNLNTYLGCISSLKSLASSFILYPKFVATSLNVSSSLSISGSILNTIAYIFLLVLSLRLLVVSLLICHVCHILALLMSTLCFRISAFFLLIHIVNLWCFHLHLLLVLLLASSMAFLLLPILMIVWKLHLSWLSKNFLYLFFDSSSFTNLICFFVLLI